LALYLQRPSKGKKGQGIMKKLSIIVATASMTITAAGLAFAADLPKEGNYDHRVCFTRNIARIVFSDSHRAYSYEETGTVISASPGGIFDGEKVRCVGAVAVANNKRTGLSMCEGVATDGAKRLTRFHYDADGKLVREEVAGTGMYDGMVTTGTVQEVVAPKEVTPGTTTFCNQLTGTYRLK
jgi:hypothetical protein